MAAQDGSVNNSNALLDQIIANSTFTAKQISIISKRLSGPGKANAMTSGSYYRQVRQCREKTIAVLYSYILLELTGAITPETSAALAKITSQLRVILGSENRDIVIQSRSDDVISVINHVIQRVCKL